MNIQETIERQRREKELMRMIPASLQRPKPRRDPAKLSKRQVAEVKALVISELRACYSDISRKLREMPAWEKGYNSALSTIDLRIAAFEARDTSYPDMDPKKCTCPPNGG